MVEPWPEDALDVRAGLEQHVPQPVRDSGAVVGEVVVVAAEHAQLLQEMVAGGEPMHPCLVDAGGVGDHEAVAPIGLRLTGI